MTAAPGPRVVVVLLDSLNRHLLSASGGDEFDTPHLDRFAESAIVFDHHHVGSLPCPDERATLTRMTGTTAPVIRQPFGPGNLLPVRAYGMPIDDHHLYDAADSTESDNQAGSVAETEVIERLRDAVVSIDAPAHQLERLGLS